TSALPIFFFRKPHEPETSDNGHHLECWKAENAHVNPIEEIGFMGYGSREFNDGLVKRGDHKFLSKVLIRNNI
ncbi:MAG TPA: hypothetical protein VFS88_08355, partial [Micavibrio sp.]|nr:hypothetical protein [Micavibrio sp.]